VYLTVRSITARVLAWTHSAADLEAEKGVSEESFLYLSGFLQLL